MSLPSKVSNPEHNDSVRCLDISQDGFLVASGASDHTIRLWNTATGEANGGPLTGHKDWVRCVSFSPDGRLIGSGSGPEGRLVDSEPADCSVRLWDMETQESIRTFIGHTGTVRYLQFSPDGKVLASGSDDTTLRIWEVEDGKMPRGPLVGHTK